jgi:rRNA biogenesis protein RRP5
MTKLKSLSAKPTFWLNYATYLLTTRNDATAARSLLLRATQSVPTPAHRSLTAKFGALEFKSPAGDTERGRTIFEQLLSAYPKRLDVWETYMDLERGYGSKERVRGLYERMVGVKMKKGKAVAVFKRWLEFEEVEGTEADKEKVRGLAGEYARRLKEKGDGGAED